MSIPQGYIIEISDTFQIDLSTLGFRAFAVFVLKFTQNCKGSVTTRPRSILKHDYNAVIISLWNQHGILSEILRHP